MLTRFMSFIPQSKAFGILFQQNTRAISFQLTLFSHFNDFIYNNTFYSKMTNVPLV